MLTFFAIYLLTLPYRKLIGAALLLWIGVGLLKGEDEDSELDGHSNLAAAIKTIIIADLVIARAARELGCDRIVMGREGNAGLAGKIFGSLTQQVRQIVSGASDCQVIGS